MHRMKYRKYKNHIIKRFFKGHIRTEKTVEKHQMYLLLIYKGQTAHEDLTFIFDYIQITIESKFIKQKHKEIRGRSKSRRFHLSYPISVKDHKIINKLKENLHKIL